MEFILEKSDIFDESISDKFNGIIKLNKNKFYNDALYSLKVSFHVNLLKSPKFDEFYLPERKKWSKNTRNEKIYDVMSFQLEKLEKILEECGIETCSLTIQGNNIESENIIIIQIVEDIAKPKCATGAKKKSIGKTRSIIPSLPFTQENIAEQASKRLSKIYNDFMNAIIDKKIMSEILEIQPTEDDNVLFKHLQSSMETCG